MMQRVGHALAAASLAALAACGTDLPSTASSERPGALEPSATAYGVFPGSQYGIVWQGNYLNTWDNKVRAAQLLRDGGVKFARVSAYWYQLQQFGDNTFTGWELQPLKESIQALTDAGITPYVTLEGTACFARSKPYPCTVEDVRSPPDGEAHWQAYTTYVQQMMREFPNVQYWGIGNEPNSEWLLPNGGNRLAAYRQLVERAAPAIRAAGRVVIGLDLGDGYDGSTGMWPQQWLESFMSTHGGYVDVVAVHSYNAAVAGSGSTLETQMRGYANALAHGPWDLWLTEVAMAGGNAAECDQERHLGQVYNLMNSRVVSRWSKTFYYNAGGFNRPGETGQDWGIVRDLGTSSQAPRVAYDTYRRIATGSTRPSLCSMIIN